MFSSRSMKNFHKDLFNRHNLRNASNTDQFEYNCAGFALGTFSWYCPSHTGDVWGWRDWDMDYMEELTKECVEIMLNDFADLRVIADMNELGVGEYAIAFRVSSDGDFHYIRQMFYGTWKHKTGCGNIYEMNQEEVFTAEWCGRYDGPIVLFAKKF